jgi:hypothetical protein
MPNVAVDTAAKHFVRAFTESLRAADHERRSTAELCPQWSTESSVINILPLKTEIKHRVPGSPARDRPFELEITFCVGGRAFTVAQ